jgi:cytosine/adenosine deaminase-related metal-dependent hydrolase
VLEETALFPIVNRVFAAMGPAGMKRLLKAGAEQWARYGYTTVQEGRAMPPVVDAMTGLKALTIWAAHQHFEEGQKGSLEVGKLADLVVLSADPTAVDPETIDQIKILETIKQGQTIYPATRQRAADSPGRAAEKENRGEGRA